MEQGGKGREWSGGGSCWEAKFPIRDRWEAVIVAVVREEVERVGTPSDCWFVFFEPGDPEDDGVGSEGSDVEG